MKDLAIPEDLALHNSLHQEGLLMLVLGDVNALFKWSQIWYLELLLQLRE